MPCPVALPSGRCPYDRTAPRPLPVKFPLRQVHVHRSYRVDAYYRDRLIKPMSYQDQRAFGARLEHIATYEA